MFTFMMGAFIGIVVWELTKLFFWSFGSVYFFLFRKHIFPSMHKGIVMEREGILQIPKIIAVLKGGAWSRQAQAKEEMPFPYRATKGKPR